MKTFLYVLCLCGSVLVSTGAEIYSDCGSKVHISRLAVSGCEKTPCILKKGTNVNLYAEFQLENDMDNLQGEVAGILAGGLLTVPFKKDPQVCNHLLRGECGVNASAAPMTYVAQFTVPPRSPNIPVTARWTIADQLGNRLVCVLIKSKVQ